MKLPIYQVDAFADGLFSGNPAAVIPLLNWLPDKTLQAIAEQNNLSETAFYTREEGGQFRIRWFTPSAEVDLCGHATLATAHVLFAELGFEASDIVFSSRSGDLPVRHVAGVYTLNFPKESAIACPVPDHISEALGVDVSECYFNADYLVVVKSEEAVAGLSPDFSVLAKLPSRGVIVTAPGDEVDFVCRFFAPAVGINEDPVTGSAFTKLVPHWAERLHKERFRARQISPRGGNVDCLLDGDRVLISGQARTYLRGSIEV